MKKSLFISIIILIVGISACNTSETKKPEDHKDDCEYCKYKKVYGSNGFVILKKPQSLMTDEEKNSNWLAFEQLQQFYDSRPIHKDTAAYMIRNLKSLKTINYTCYIDFDYTNILEVLDDLGTTVPSDQKGLRIYLGTYDSRTRAGKGVHVISHPTAVVIGTANGVDNIGGRIVNYGNLCPPMCAGGDGSSVESSVPVDRALLYYEKDMDGNAPSPAPTTRSHKDTEIKKTVKPQ